jgi:GNAT superfamily N-acetyltransferase
MTVIEVRSAAPGDLPGIAAVALANGPGEEWSGADPAYVRHLLAYGTVVVGVSGGSVVGFGAVRTVATRVGAVSMLCDLFVDPGAHGSGCGRAMLAALWPAPGRRMTFSSLHSSALPLYARFGVDPWWPLLYLQGPVSALAAPGGWQAGPAAPAEVARMERAWTGADRFDDHLAWARRPGGAGVLARRGREVMAAGTVGGAGREYGVTHLAVAPAADAAAAVLAVLASLEGETARVCLPGPHPAVRALLAAGWRVEEFDLFMATDPGLLDPRRAVPSPALA